VTRKTISELKKAGLSRLSLTLEAGTPEAHDRLCGITGSFAGTLNAMRWSNECGLPLEIRTNLRRRNLHELENIAAVLKSFKILSWSISFPVPQPRESLRDLPCSSEFEEAFSSLHQLAQELPFKVKTVDAPHYRRFVVQQRSRARTNGGGLPAPQTLDGGIPGILPVNESRASIFISSTGDIFPSHGLRVAAGNIRRQKVADVYRNSELFRSLRDTGNLKGKCRDCEFKEMCGGSRARAWAVNEDMFAEEPCCSYLPATARKTG
jgi:radical SAM protein with 4Fe4S-binding SPASM domain